MNKVMRRLVLPGVIVIAGVGISKAMIALSPKAERVEGTVAAVLVEAMTAEARDVVAVFQGTGAIEPARKVSLALEVAGSLVWVSDEALPGGRFSKGDLIARVDKRLYQLAVEQAEGAATQAELEVQLERSRKAVAEREWEILGDGRSPEVAPLALRIPQLATTEAAAASARSALEKLQLDLSHTELRAPFNSVVVEESIEVGQLVGSGAAVITLVGTDAARVEVSIPVEKLALVDLPDGDRPGSTATITQALGDGSQVVREGRVHRLVGQLDPGTRTATLLVLVDDPMGGEGLPLLPGAFVTVEIRGVTRGGIIELPRQAIRGGNTAWIVGPDEALQKRTLEVAWGSAQSVFVSGGIETGERVVTSAISIPIEGQIVRVSESGRASDAQGTAGL
jgi:RND family efflux transporter MFP subunit